MRVVQRNLVYVVGLALDICYEDVLKGLDYFGQYGKIVKVRLSRTITVLLFSRAFHCLFRWK